MNFIPLQTKLSGFNASEPFSSFFVLLVYGNKATIGIPFLIALPTAIFSLSTLYLNTFGIDFIDSFLFFPSIKKIGRIKSL